MHEFSGVFVLIAVLGMGCKPSSTDAPPTTGDVAAESGAPVESEPTEDETPAKVVDPNACVLVEDEWEKCDGQLVVIEGENAGMIQQHPNLAGPDDEQGYMDVEGVGQIILLTKHEVDCSDAMQVEGTLERVDLGGAAGTKESYQGWVIKHAQVTCQ